MKAPGPRLAGVAGGTGAGKTSCTRALLELLERDAVLVELDWYYLPQDHLPLSQRARLNFDHPSAFDWPLLLSQLDALLAGQAIQAPRYDYARHTRLPEPQVIRPRPWIILEGILALAREDLVSRMAAAFYIDAPRALRLARRIQRDQAERGRTQQDVARQFADQCEPMHQAWVAPTRDRASLVLDGQAPPTTNARKAMDFLAHLHEISE